MGMFMNSKKKIMIAKVLRLKILQSLNFKSFQSKYSYYK